jgi:hypothetical protein
MLRLKENVDINILGKYGFKEFDGKYNEHIDGYVYETEKPLDYSFILIPKYNREVCCGGEMDTLYDLIKADLVEKVEEK